jgi:hypothetical protein
MAQTIGESRDEWGMNTWLKVEEFANSMKKVKTPFYIVYAAKQDRPASERLGTGVYREAIKAYYKKPPAILGILVWYVDNKAGIFEFRPELSAPPDVPLDPNLLSDKASDASARVMEQGEKLKAIVS